MSTELATQGEPPTLVAALKAMGPEIQRALPKHMSGDRIARITLTLVRQNPNLAQCTPASFFGALLTAAALGLEPGVNGECYLVPYKTDCTLIVGYQGVAKLFWQHPLAKRLSAEYVCAKDHFAYDKGLKPRLEHTPATGERGPVIGYYAIAELNTGALQFDYFKAAQVKALRRGAVGTKGVADPEHWMERKTALKQVLKLMPKSVELIQAVAVDESIGSMATAKAIHDGAGLPQIERSPVVDVDVAPGEGGSVPSPAEPPLDPSGPDGDALFPGGGDA